MKATFKKIWFNPLYFILNDLLKDSSIRTVLVYGGKSSSKTVSIAQLLSKELCVYSNSSIAFRKESTTIGTTIKKSFDLARESLYLQAVMDRFDKFYRNNETDAEIQLKGIDDEEKAKGIESYKYVYLDELNHFTFPEFNQFQMSLRGINGQKIFASWNPVDENHWIKKQIINNEEWVDTSFKLPCETSFVKRSKDGKTILIKTTYEDNYWISGSPCGTYGYRDQNLIDYYNKLKEIDENQYKVNVLGEWGTSKEGKIFTNWELFEELPGSYDLHIYGLDFGFSISKTACVKVVISGNNIYLKEIIYELGLNNIELAERLKQLDTNSYIVCDCAEPKSIDELRMFGISAIPCGNKQDMFDFFVQKMNTYKVHLHKESHNLIYEWQNLTYATDRNGIPIGGQVKKDDHLFDATKYAVTLYMI